MENKIKSLIRKLNRFGFSVKPKKESYIDPVCGMEASSDLFQTNFREKSYYFCSNHCKEQFENGPGNFVTK